MVVMELYLLLLLKECGGKNDNGKVERMVDFA
jgi:hypothetical protein